MALYNVEKKLNQKKARILALWRGFKRMEQELKNIRAKKEIFHRTTRKVITSAIGLTAKRSKQTDRIVACVELDIFCFSNEGDMGFSMYFRH